MTEDSPYDRPSNVPDDAMTLITVGQAVFLSIMSMNAEYILKCPCKSCYELAMAAVDVSIYDGVIDPKDINYE